MKHNKENHGMALITILLMMVILVMLTVTLITVNTNNLLYTLNYNTRVSALMAAESGVAYAIYELQKKSDWEPAEVSETTSNGKFTIYFKPDTSVTDYYSTNNLDSPGSDPNGYRNFTVPPNSVDLIVTGQSGSTVRRLRVTLGRENISEGGRCSGIAKIYADKFIVQRATTAKDQNQGGSFHSNYKDISDPNNPSIRAFDPVENTFTEVDAFGGVISACGGIDIRLSDVNTAGTQLRPNVEPKPIPDIDIKNLVNSNSTSNNTNGGTYILKQDTKGGPFKLYLNGTATTIPGTYIDDSKGQLVFTDDVYFNSNVTFEFPMVDNHYGTAGIKLEKTGSHYPSLYINETNSSADSFLVRGKVEGNGSIYNTGSTKFIMETELVASQETGTELLSEKDINISLPASRLSSIDLSLTGAVLTHGNLNATILDPNDIDNPSIAMSDNNKWPNDWVEQAYDGIVPAPSPSPTAISIPSSGLVVGDITFVPNDASTAPGSGPTYYDINGITSSTATLTINGDGTYTFGGDANYIHMYYKGWTCAWDTMNDWIANGTTLGGTSTADIHPAVWTTGFGGGQSAGPSYVIKTFFNNDPAKFKTHVYNALTTYEQNNAGPSPSPSPVQKVAGDLYAPDVSITGALVVTDPNNLDGTKPHNTAAGNINVDLRGVRANDNGIFTIVHSRNYEKLLASSEIRTKIVVNTWEELR